MSATVRTIKTFKSGASPCPVLGTIGRIVGNKEDYCIVRFDLPMKNTDGRTVLPYEEKTFLDIYFRTDEIEVIK